MLRHATRCRRFAVLFTWLATLPLPACSSGDAGGGASPEAVWRDGEQWRLHEEARIGGEAAEGPTAFGQIVDLELDALGRVWVADHQQYEVRVFGWDGSHVRSLGGKGGGPEDFGGLGGMAWAPDGRLWVLDSGNSRFAVYDTAGALVTTHRRDPAFTVIPWPGRFDRQGLLNDITAFHAADGPSTRAIVRLDSTLTARDTFLLPEFEGEFFEVRSQNGNNVSVNRINVPFTGAQVWALDEDGSVWMANTSEYRIRRHTLAGDSARQAQRTVTPIPVTSQARARARETFADFIRQGGKIDESRIPSHYPALNTFFMDDESRLWVHPSNRRGEPVVADVFEPTGRYLGQVRIPKGVGFYPAPAIRGDRMAAVSRNDLGEEAVVLLRIERPGGS